MIIRREYSVPEQLTLLGAGAAVLGALYPVITEHTGDCGGFWGVVPPGPHSGLPCPLRTLTGIPCPFCGLTTVTVALTHGQWTDAAKANPLVYAGAAAAIGTAPVLVARALGKAAPPRPMSTRDRRRLAAAAIAISAGSWLYQLRRADLI
jgi:hypothetical protein